MIFGVLLLLLPTIRFDETADIASAIREQPHLSCQSFNHSTHFGNFVEIANSWATFNASENEMI
jgi:hypothetical protein